MLKNSPSFESLETLFFDPSRHQEALALLASASLNANRSETAFMFADRRCRLPTPSGRDFLLRAAASALAGHAEYAAQDLARALEIDPTDDMVASSALAWGPEPLRALAAAAFIAGDSEDRQGLELALAAVKSAGDRIAARLRRRADLFAGWVAWIDNGPIELRIRREGETSAFLLDADPAHPIARDGWSAAEIAIELESPALRSANFYLDGQLALTLSPTPDPQAAPRRRRTGGNSAPSPAKASAHVDVIVPVYENFEATKACLDCLEREASKISKRILAIDDCTPNQPLRELLDERAARGALTLIRNDENLGFARSVNRALQLCREGDVLLVNADAFLPTGAIDQLAAAAQSASDIGTVTPLSNNGEFTSFPEPNVANALEPAETIRRLNQASWIANGADVVDLPNGIGFCMYVTRACLEAVGPLPDLYSRGYYEDVEFCLRARELGFRNVCATGVYVGHAGARSFRGQKRGLVMRNLAILELRFPDYRLECAAFVKADPLAQARARLEERLAVNARVVLLVSPGGSARSLVMERARQIEAGDEGLHCLHCQCSELDGRAILRSVRETAPQSLDFAISQQSGLARLRSYLERLDLAAIELFDAQAIPEAVFSLLLELPACLNLVLGDLQWISGARLAFEKTCPNLGSRGACGRCLGASASAAPSSPQGIEAIARRFRDVLRKGGALIPLDRMASAFSGAHLAQIAVAPRTASPSREPFDVPSTPNRRVLGVLSPFRRGQTDRLVMTLGRMFLELGIDASIVVFGPCADDLALMTSGKVFVAGRIAQEELARAMAQYRVSKLFSPLRTSHFGMLDELAKSARSPKAYFDWSFGTLGQDENDLALDPRVCNERAALDVGAWLMDEPIERDAR